MSKANRRTISFIRRELKKWHPPAVRTAYENWLAIAEKDSSVGGKLQGRLISVQGVTG